MSDDEAAASPAAARNEVADEVTYIECSPDEFLPIAVRNRSIRRTVLNRGQMSLSRQAPQRPLLGSTGQRYV